MMNDRTVLIVIGVMLVILMASILYVTHQPIPAPTNQQALSSTTTATSTTSSAQGTKSTSTQTEKSTTTTSNTSRQTSGSSHSNTPATPPHITKFLPAAGTPGTTVTIIGTGFSAIGNHVFFGSSGNRYHADGTPANQIATVDSSNGTTITFTVPTSGPSGLLCDQGGCIAVSAIAITPGSYPVTVSNAAGTSNTVSYIIIK